MAFYNELMCPISQVVAMGRGGGGGWA